MKNRNLDHSDDWETPPWFYAKLNSEFNFDFDPCPLANPDGSYPQGDGLILPWGKRNYINPPYNQRGKEAFVKRAYEESKNGNLCVCLIPVSTSTNLFHDIILPNAEIRFIKRRLPFIGINTKGQYVNWHLTKRIPPKGAVHVKNSGMHDSMLVIFGGKP